MTITCLLLGLAGCLAVFNATFHRAAPLAFVARQAVWLVAAAAVMLAAAGRGPKFWRRSLPFWAAGAYAALLLVLLCGERVNGMRGWFAWHGVFIQPSELAKPIFLLCLASRLEYRSEDLRNGKGYLSLLGLFGLWAVPLILHLMNRQVARSKTGFFLIDVLNCQPKSSSVRISRKPAALTRR